ncbi:MAG: hypothetical protein Q9173_002272 [Seirophora scorigena]
MFEQLDSSLKVVASIDRAMNTLRLARTAARVIPARVIGSPLQRRGYADAVSDKIQLTLALPHQVNIPAESGEMGVLANHVPSIEQLRPGLIEIIEESGGSKQFFCACIFFGPVN